MLWACYVDMTWKEMISISLSHQTQNTIYLLGNTGCNGGDHMVTGISPGDFYGVKRKGCCLGRRYGHWLLRSEDREDGVEELKEEEHIVQGEANIGR